MIFGKSKILGWIFRHKWTFALFIAFLAFFISTVVLFVQKNEAQSDLVKCIEDREGRPITTTPVQTQETTEEPTTTTEEPTAPTEEPTTTTEEPTTTTEEPITTTEEPITTTEEPITTTEEPITTTEEPITTTEEPPTTTEEPITTTTEEPPTTTEEPITTTEEPPTTTEEPITTTEEPPTTTEEPITTTEEPITTTEEPITTTEEPPTTTEEPITTTEEPITTTEEPPTTTEEPITTTEEPITTTEEPPTTTEEPITTTEEPPTTTEEPITTTEEPITTTEEPPTTTEEPITTTEEPPTTTEEPITTTTEEPITTTQEPTTTTEEPLPDPRYRLSSDVVAISYDLYLHPHLPYNGADPETLFLFEGTNTISIYLSKITYVISLHSNGLEIETVRLSYLTGGEVLMLVEFVPEYDLIVISNMALDIGNYTLFIEFSGDMRNRIVGLYSSSYVNQDGGTTHIATSKFEPTYARQAFPCFDEPAMKARFKISLVIPNGDNYTALSNMDIESTETISQDLLVVHFRESVQMSTYLACFIVSDFISKTSEVAALDNSTTFPMSVYATPAQIDKTEFALMTGINITKFYIEYFQIDYPLPKLDMVAIPDFVSGAMEHWGLVTFRETSLLFDQITSSTLNKQRVATVVAHELAHMWFGNLVTMQWWNDLWLNEGFASYIEAKGTDFVYPEWGMMDQFIIDDLHPVLTIDATLASHPIVQVAHSPDQITELFDSITYSKGASIIRMLEHFVGIEHFQNAVTNYLTEHAFSNAVTDDLLTQIDIGLDIDVKDIMATWTEQMGFPLVTVEKISNTLYRLTQKRFLSNPDSDDESLWTGSEYLYKWSIPITYFTDVDELSDIVWFNKGDNQIELTVSENHNWIKLNNDQIDYYRINYPTDVWDSFTSALLENVAVLSISNRAHLLNDAFSLADATILDYSTALNLMNYLSSETAYVPWSVAASKLTSLKNILYGTDLYEKFIPYAQKLIQSAYETVDWESSSQEHRDHLRNHLRTTIFGIASSIKLPSCVDQVTTRFNNWINDVNDVRPIPDLRNVIYYYGMEYSGNQIYWDRLWELYQNETDASEKIKLMNALAAVQDPIILQRFIDLAWIESNVRGQDYFSCLIYISQNRIGEPLVWDYVRENWEQLVERFGLNERYLGNMIPSITSRFSTQLQLDEMKEFFSKYPDAGAGAAARLRALDTVQYNINWLSQNKIKVENWLNENLS